MLPARDGPDNGHGLPWNDLTSIRAMQAIRPVGDYTSTWIKWARLQLLSGVRQLIQLGRQFTGSIWLKVHLDNELAVQPSRFFD